METPKIKVKLKIPVALFSSGSIKIRDEEIVEVPMTMNVIKLLQEKILIKVNE